nr:uncharacterized protein LOC122270226 [Parasteatoda tepidariorum]
MIFDEKLTFKPHIFYIKRKCSQSLNILKVPTNCSWGADMDAMLKIYRSVIRSKLDCGISVYSSARQSVLKYLDTIHHQGLRISSGAFRTLPVESLYVLCSEPSLHFRRYKLSLDYYFKIKANPLHPLYSCVCHPQLVTHFSSRPSYIPSFGIRITNILCELNILNFEVFTYTDAIPPWVDFTACVLNVFNNLKKSETNPTVFTQRFYEHRHQYMDFTPIYTDGSKHDNHVGCGVAYESFNMSEKFLHETSIFTAECYAILLALNFISDQTKNKWIIYTDSRSFISSVPYIGKNPIIQKIQNHFMQLQVRGFNIYFCWIPSHFGILGNDRADIIAKTTQNLSSNLLTCSDVKHICKSSVHQEWKNHWNIQNNNKLHEIYPNLDNCKTFTVDRKTQTLINRLRIGHTRFTHMHLLVAEPAPSCTLCQVDISIKHILTNCRRFKYLRKKLFGRFYPNLSSLLSDPIHHNLIKFIKTIGLYSLI